MSLGLQMTHAAVLYTPAHRTEVGPLLSPLRFVLLMLMNGLTTLDFLAVVYRQNSVANRLGLVYCRNDNALAEVA